jgi:hypothetical protein
LDHFLALDRVPACRTPRPRLKGNLTCSIRGLVFVLPFPVAFAVGEPDCVLLPANVEAELQDAINAFAYQLQASRCCLLLDGALAVATPE